MESQFTNLLTNSNKSAAFLYQLKASFMQLTLLMCKKSKDLQKYFEAQPWYKPDPEFKDDQLSETDFKNISLIKSFEETAISKFAEVEG